MEATSEVTPVKKERVFRNKAGTIEIVCPKIGEPGWFDDGSGVLVRCVYDKGGKARYPRKQDGRGGQVYDLEPKWVTLLELKERKEARSRYWKLVKGPAHWKEIQRGDDSFFFGRIPMGCYS